MNAIVEGQNVMLFINMLNVYWLCVHVNILRCRPRYPVQLTALHVARVWWVWPMRWQRACVTSTVSLSTRFVRSAAHCAAIKGMPKTMSPRLQSEGAAGEGRVPGVATWKERAFSEFKRLRRVTSYLVVWERKNVGSCIDIPVNSVQVPYFTVVDACNANVEFFGARSIQQKGAVKMQQVLVEQHRSLEVLQKYGHTQDEF